MSNKQSPAGVPGLVATSEGPGAAVAQAMKGDVAVSSAVAREMAEIRTAVEMAVSFPRDESLAHDRLLRSMERPKIADGAEYSFPRGKKKDPETGRWVKNYVTGPSVKLAREAARCWGNIRSGLQILAHDGKKVHVRGWALDCERNVFQAVEDRFSLLIQRKDREGETRWVVPDERDARELILRRGAITERNAILKVLPPDYIEDALDQARKTLRASAGADDPEARAKAATKMVRAFEPFGVSESMLAAWAGGPLEQTMTPEKFAELKRIGASIRDGQAEASEWFDVSGPSEEPTDDPFDGSEKDPEKTAPTSLEELGEQLEMGP